MSAVAFVTVVTSLVVLVCFTSFLFFCAFVVRHTGGTAGLRDVAVAIGSFRGVLGLRGRL